MAAEVCMWFVVCLISCFTRDIILHANKGTFHIILRWGFSVSPFLRLVREAQRNDQVIKSRPCLLSFACCNDSLEKNSNQTHSSNLQVLFSVLAAWKHREMTLPQHVWLSNKFLTPGYYSHKPFLISLESSSKHLNVLWAWRLWTTIHFSKNKFRFCF